MLRAQTPLPWPGGFPGVGAAPSSMVLLALPCSSAPWDELSLLQAIIALIQSLRFFTACSHPT